jgi:hypothetical protein
MDELLRFGRVHGTIHSVRGMAILTHDTKVIVPARILIQLNVPTGTALLPLCHRSDKSQSENIFIDKLTIGLESLYRNPEKLPNADTTQLNNAVLLPPNDNFSKHTTTALP